jgi:hypothetical protein
MSSYQDGDLKKPSVTTIIGDCSDKSGPLTQWAANCVVKWIEENSYKDVQKDEVYFVIKEAVLEAARTNYKTVSQTALDVGSMVHGAIETYLTTGAMLETENEQAAAGFKAFIDWAAEHELKTHHCELQVLSKYWGGTMDWLGMLNGKLTVIDFKTSKAIYPEYRYQIAAYRSVVGAEASGILRLDKETGLPEYKDFSKTYEADLAVFNAMVNLYFLRHPRVAKAAGVPF